MSIDGTIMRRARARLAARKEEAESRLQRRTEEVYLRLPRMRELDRELRGTMLQAVTLSASGREEELAQLREKNLALQEERTAVLTGAGYDPEYLDDQPFCPVCRDTGVTPSGGVCDCLKALYREEQKKDLSSLLKMGEETFDNFDLDWYSDKPDPTDGVSPRMLMDLAYESCLRYAQSFGKKSVSLLLTGGTGLGKTFLSTCIAREVSEKGFSVVYDTAGTVFGRYESDHFGRGGSSDEEREIREEQRRDLRRYQECDLLILDDLGTEMTTSFTVSVLYALVNGRLAAGKKTIISTNLTPEAIRDRYSPQIYSRIAGEYQILRFRGQDIRLLKKARR